MISPEDPQHTPTYPFDEARLGEMKQEGAALIERITAAFDGVAREDGITIHEAVALDDYLSEKECLAARARDTESRWQDVPERDIRTCTAVLPFLDEKGLRYYLPAYLIVELKTYVTGEQEPRDDIVNWLVQWGHWSQKGYGRNLLTPEQSRVAADFLRFVLKYNTEYYEEDLEDIQEALDQYWSKF